LRLGNGICLFQKSTHSKFHIKPQFRDDIPVYVPGTYQKIYIILKATNQTNKPILFPKFSHTIPSLYADDGQPISEVVFCTKDSLYNPMEIGSIFVFPYQTINLLFTGMIYWDPRNNLQMDIGNEYTNISSCFTGLEAGIIQMRFSVRNSIDEIFNGLESCQSWMDPQCEPMPFHHQEKSGKVPLLCQRSSWS
jgi:hypothetical protein